MIFFPAGRLCCGFGATLCLTREGFALCGLGFGAGLCGAAAKQAIRDPKRKTRNKRSLGEEAFASAMGGENGRERG